MKITKVIAMAFMASATLSITSVCSATAVEAGISGKQKRLKVLGLTPPAGSQSQPDAGQRSNQLQSDQSLPDGKSESADGARMEETTPGEGEPGVVEAEIATSVQPSKPEQAGEADRREPDQSLTRGREPSPAGGKAHTVQSHWGYSGAGAPYYWARLQPEFATCGRGRNQSPIHISTVTVTTLPAVNHDYQEASFEKIWAVMPEASGQTVVEKEVKINAATLLPQGIRSALPLLIPSWSHFQKGDISVRKA